MAQDRATFQELARTRLRECWSNRGAIQVGKRASELALGTFIEPRLRQCCARLAGDVLVSVELKREIAAC